MLQFLKVFGRGVLVTVLSPFILLIWVLYGVYCIGVFIVMFIIGVINYFRGIPNTTDTVEDQEAKRMLLEKEKQEEEAKDALSMMYRSAMAQTINPPKEENNLDNPYEENPEPFGSDEYGSDADFPDENEQQDDVDGDFGDDLRGN